MPTDFRLPDLGEGVTEGQVVRLLVAEGDQVTEDQPLLEVETDKVSVEIPSPHTGVVAKLHVVEKQVINVGAVMVTFAEDFSTPAAAVEPKPKAAATAPAAARSADGPADTGVTVARTVAGRTKPASPAVRKLARQLGADLQTIEGSGPGGRVLRQDVERAAAAPSPQAVPDQWGPTRREPMTRARRTIAQVMARSASTIPHVTDTDDADVTDLDRLRREYHGRKLTILTFVVRATAMALQEHPLFNARFDAETGDIIYHEYISIAIGVHTERGLIAPVIRNVDTLTIPQIADELEALAEKARRATLAVNDTRGGTFTISNAGAMGGSRYSTPIINHPQSAVLSLGRTRLQPWVVKGKIVPRSILPLSLSFDHRLIDGANEVVFMQAIIGLLQDPAELG
ncbi:MAG: 2-oxo acid dehydrogenase subunit E2 [Planctomycetes bacterium]|nr:2-oxo acid dehydrogenase subunit E2 [Planctomycetota bacterium]